MSHRDFDVAIIGAGIVGCAVFFELTRCGYKCVMLERNSHILSEASSGNSGMLATGFDAPPGSCELDCLKATQESIFQVMTKFHTPHEKCGTVLVAWSEDDRNQAQQLCLEASEVGIEASTLTPSDLHRKEPSLTKVSHGGLLVPGEAVVDSGLLGVSYAHHAHRQGSTILTNGEVYSFHDHWLETSRGGMSASAAINCAGLYGDVVDGFVGSQFYSIKPRKGQYCVFNKSMKPVVNSIIFPLPTEKSKGVAVFKTVYGNIVSGPTAQDVPERTRPAFDVQTHNFLHSHALSLFADLDGVGVAGHYTGVRPATQFRDYQIKAIPSRNWISVGGIRSTGVSASLGIAQLVKEKLVDEIGLEASRGPQTTVDEIRWQFQKDTGSYILDGVRYQASHPIARFGFQPSESKL